MPLLPWLLWALFGGTLGGPFQSGTWPALGTTPVKTTQDGARSPSFYHLPMYQHAPRPLIAKELFRPVPRQSPLPVGLSSLLFPTMREQGVQETGVRAVNVWCGLGEIFVRVDRFQLRAWPIPSLFRLGSCQASKISKRFLHFDYKLTDCDGESKVVGDQLVYTHLLCYTPPPQGYVIRAVPLTLPINCRFNRFHYSYKVGYRPQIQQTTFAKSIRSKLGYSLTVCNAAGQPVPPGHWFFLGEPVYFLAQARVLLAGERLFVDSCYATRSREPNSVPRVDIISNYGCMTDSRRGGSSSRFLMGRGSVLAFSVDAFIFTPVSQVLYLHCSMSIGLATSHIAKSCNYNKAAGRWEELQATNSVCSCCDTMCTDIQNSIKNTVSSPGWMIKQRGDKKPMLEVRSFQAEEGIDWLDEEKSEEKMYRHKKVQTFPRETEIGREEEEEEENGKALLKKTAEKREWRHSTAVSQQGAGEKELGETEEVVVEKNLARDGIMSERTPEETREEVSDTDGFVSVLSIDNSGINVSTEDSGTTMIAQNSVSAENVSTAIIHLAKLCPDGDQISCNVTINTAGHVAMNAGIAESFTPSNVTAGIGSLSDSRVHASWRSSTLEALAGTLNLDVDPTGVLHVGKSGESRLESEMLDTLLSSVDTKSDEILGQAGDSVNSKGPHSGDDVLHSRAMRWLESDQSAPPAGFKDPIYEDVSDFDPDIEEGEALHPSQFTEAVKTLGQKEGWDTVTRFHSSGSVDSDEMHQDIPSHSAVVAVMNALQGSDSSQMFEREWAEVALGWD